MTLDPHLIQRKTARVLFDEFHSEAWSISREMALLMQPGAPFDSSYALAGQYLADRDFDIARNIDSPLTADALARADVLVVAHPSERKWEHTTNTRTPKFSGEEISAIRGFVERGGGLIVIGETENDKYGNNLNDLLGVFGIGIETVTVFDYTHFDTVTSWVKAQPYMPGTSCGIASASLLSNVGDICFYRAGVLNLSHGARPALITSDVAQPPSAPLLAVAEFGQGRVVAVADSDWLGDEFFGAHDHSQLWANMVYWAAAKAFAPSCAQLTVAPLSPLSHPSHAEPAPTPPAWLTLKSAVDRLRGLQNADGSINVPHHGQAATLVEEMAVSIYALKPAFGHQVTYLGCVIADLHLWIEGGFGKPDFARSLAAFNPQAMRQDGIEHLVVLPMYTPNASSDIRFEALRVKVPWPDWLDYLERTQYHNQKFVPLVMIDNTAGYDSECAVLFPETVSVGAAANATNNFGGIFCDREARRYQRAVTKAAGILGLTLPPDLAAWIRSPDLVRETFMLWDLIHDTSHSHGDLPFDPFMIRQRLPYWMYSLEELRVDLWSFCESNTLEQRFPFARYMRYAILLDRIIRFPITGNRLRNYDGLGGQLLFAFLHQRGDVRWHDNALSIDWDAAKDGVAELREKVDGLYRCGIDMTKVQYWIAAHDLVSSYVRPNIASKWAGAARVISDESVPKEWINRVLDDEFPLSLFYQTLQKKMAKAADT